ncbi:hypothetical protein H2200_001806 [Cladophialophora chaetospira]|uniref:Ketoreductase domain-containing protein n=1 Tax=Cladophialophora chaetospira TaxID=386627 RepID=A0AA39CPF2_9EURO|nr:hypothetical protein H2200_001806 [Cladophialophora chaetospira]
MSETVWVITGTSSGFGKAIAYTALSKGATVVATARKSSKLQDLKAAGADTIDLDVTSDMETLKETAAKVVQKHGKVTHLINAAGYVLDAAVEEANPQETYDQFNTNVFGTLNVSRAFLPFLRKQPDSVLATFGSMASWVPGPTFGIYASTKFAVSGVTEAMRMELDSLNVRVCVIEPGYFRSNLLGSDARIQAKTLLPEYEATVVGETRRALDAAHQNQLGDVEKAAKVIVDVLTCSGVARGKEIPVRLVLGSDIQAAIRQKCKETLSLLDEWAEISRTTDHSD